MEDKYSWEGIRLGGSTIVGVTFPTDEDREITPEEVHVLYQNAQAVALLFQV
jgi:hypothetical protein